MTSGQFRIILIVLSALMFIAQAWIIISWTHSKRKKMWQWIVEKWNLFRNNVVELNHSAGDDNIEVF